MRYSNMLIWPLFYSVPNVLSIEDTDYWFISTTKTHAHVYGYFNVDVVRSLYSSATIF